MTEELLYRSVARFDLLDPKQNIISKMNKFAVIAILFSCAVGAALNYLLRMLGERGGMYFVYILTGVVLCYVYIYLHEFTHALGILIVKREMPKVSFGKIAAMCGSPTIVFSKAQYVFVASLPLVFFCALLIPLCVLLPAEFFPLPFMPLCYNVFGSMGDVYMIYRTAKLPKGGAIIDGGAELCLYAPERG